MVSARSTAALLAGLVASALLAVPAPSVAEPVFVDVNGSLASSYTVNAFGTGCTHFAVPLPPQVLPVHENAGPVTVTSQATGSSTGPTAGDTASISADATATASVTSVAGLPRSVDYTITGHTSLVTAQPVSACSVQGDAELTLVARFVLTSPGYLSIAVTNDSHTFVSAGVFDTEGNRTLSVSGFGWKTEHRVQVRVPAGTYDAEIDGSVGTQSASSDSGSGTAGAHVTFTPFGALTGAATGKGARYVTLPAAATCSGGTLDATITPRRKRAARIQQVRFFLGGRLVTKVKHPKRGATVRVPLDQAAPSQLRAEVTFARSRPHHHPNPAEVAAVYEACS